MEVRISRNLLIVFVVAIVMGMALLIAYVNTTSAGFGNDPKIKVCQIKCSNPCCQEQNCQPPECGCGGGCSGSKGCAVDNAGGCGQKGCATEATGNGSTSSPSRAESRDCCGKKACDISK